MRFISKLTFRYLRKNGFKTVLTLLGLIIFLSALISILYMGFSFRETYLEEVINTKKNYDFEIKANDEITNKVKQLDNVKKVYKTKSDSFTRNYINNKEINKKYYLQLNINENESIYYKDYASNYPNNKFVVEGRFPDKEDEILIPYNLKYISDIYKIGNSIEMNITKKLDEKYFRYNDAFSINYLRRLENKDLYKTSDFFESLDNDKSNQENLQKQVYINNDDLDRIMQDYSIKKTYKIVGYHSENITSDKFYDKYEDRFEEKDYLYNKGNVYTINDSIKDEYNIIGHFSHYKNIKSTYNEILKIQRSSIGDAAYENLNDQLISMMNPIESSSFRFLLNIILILVIFLFIAIIIFIYNMFNLNYVDKLRDLGILKVSGVTNKQILSMIIIESMFYFIISITLGYLVGYIATSLIFNYVNKSILDMYLTNKVAIKVGFSYLIPLVAVLFAFIVEFVVNLISAIFVFKASPIDSLKGQNYVKSKYKAKKFKFITKLLGYEGFLAARNISRNKKRFIVITFSVAISISMIVIINSVPSLAGFSGVNSSSFSNILGKNKKSFSLLVNDKVEKSFEEDISKINDLKLNKLNKMYRLNLIHIEPNSLEIDNKTYALILKDEDFNKISNGKEILYFNSSFDKSELNKSIKSKFAIIKEDFNIKDVKKLSKDQIIDVNLKVDKSYIPTEFSNLYGAKDYFIMSENILKDFVKKYDVGINSIYNIYEIERLKYDVNVSKDVYSILIKYDLEITANMLIIISIVKLLVYGFVALVISLGILNIINTSYTNIYTRKRELAFIGVVGIEKNKLRRIIVYENILAILLASIISLILSIVVTFLIYMQVSSSILSSLIPTLKYYAAPIRSWGITSLIITFIIYIFIIIPYNRMMKKENIINLLK